MGMEYLLFHPFFILNSIMGIIKAVNTHKPEKSQNTENVKEPSWEAQERLVEILNDSPHLVSLAGTPYEVTTLRFGTQYLIAQEVIKINKVEHANYSDILKQFAINIPSLVRVIALCLLNDKNRIFQNGDERCGMSREYEALYETLLWEGNIDEYGELLLECLKMLDVSTFFQTLDILSVFKMAITGMKKTPTGGQK